MQNFFTQSNQEYFNLIQIKEQFHQKLIYELNTYFWNTHFKAEYFKKSVERSLTLNNLGLEFIKFVPQILENDKWLQDINWNWTDDKINEVAKLCSNIANQFGFEFIEINHNYDNCPLFVIKYADDTVDKDLLARYSH